MSVLERVLEMLNDYTDDDRITVNENSTMESLQIDSLDMVEIIMTMEEEFSATVDDISEIKNVKGLVEAIEKSMKK